MTRTIIINGSEISGFHWQEMSPEVTGDDPPLPPHVRNEKLLEQGVQDLRPGEVQFDCDQRIAFDTTFEMKGDGRKFVVISSNGPRHIAKPY